VKDEEEIESVAAPTLKITSAVVERPLSDTELLIRQRGAVSGLDHVHTAFHGYLKAVCEDVGLLPEGDPSITDLFKIVRKQHPKLHPPPPGAKEIDSILGPMATIVNALNPLRNRSSVAHPNDDLLEEPEAMLVINAVRTLLHYLNSRIGL
jgi:Abortive infection C-terminus